MRDLRGHLRPALGDGQPPEHPLVDEAQLELGCAGEQEADPQVLLVGDDGRLHQHLAAHPEVTEQRVSVVEGEPDR